MKKIIAMLVLCTLFLVACGSSGSDSGSAAEPVAKTEKSVTAIAEALSLSGQEEVYFSMVGAADGAQFNDGAIEVYIYNDQDAKEYKGFAANEGMYGTAYANDGAVLVFVDGDPDQGMVDTFNALVFE